MIKDNFPKEIVSHRHWFGWREERCPKAHRLVKVPYDPKNGKHASSVDPATWGTIDEAIAAVEKYKLHGIGYVFTEANGIVGVDLDKCLIDGKLNEVATGFLEKAPRTYIEKSPSGKGLHALLRDKLPPGCGKGKKNNRAGVEMYAASRYFTMTGDGNNSRIGFAPVTEGMFATPGAVYRHYIVNLSRADIPLRSLSPHWGTVRVPEGLAVFYEPNMLILNGIEIEYIPERLVSLNDIVSMFNLNLYFDEEAWIYFVTW